MLTQKEIDFIVENAKADTAKLLLAGKKFQDINLKLCINCIESRRKLISKLPQWHANTSLVYPFPLSAEQCSSEATGQYKRDLMATLLKNKKHNGPTEKTSTESACCISAADLTGGMGVDSYYLSGLCKGDGGSQDGVFHYFERNRELCKATEYNFKHLGAENIKVHNAELSKENIQQFLPTGLDFIFIDPARRSKSDNSSKVISLDEYEPNLIELQDELFKHAPVLLAKVSPMADIKLNLKLLPNATAVHIVSVDNECKELLFVIESTANAASATSATNAAASTAESAATSTAERLYDIPITAVNLKNAKVEPQTANAFTFTFKQEEQASVVFATEVGEYLYEPNKSILKAGAFKLISQRYGCSKLAASTHLYTSNEFIENFPGKIYIVEKSIPFSKKAIKEIAAQYPHADLSARNFPLDTNALKKLSGIKDGGNKHIFATSLNNGDKILIIANTKK